MLISAYRVLDRVYRDETYVGIALNDELKTLPPDARPAVTQLTYGVLEKSATLDYYIAKLCAKAPKASIRVLLRIGLYQLLYSNTPDYAAVSGTVNLAKQVGKGAQSGFINAVLKQWETVSVPSAEDEKLSFYSGKPLWYVRAIQREYPESAREILMSEPSRDTHVRGDVVKNTPYGAYLTGKQLAALDPMRTAVMSLGSCAIASAMEVKDGEEIFDACAAPGGKTVFMASSADCHVTACELYPHRVGLIEKYARSHGVSSRVTAFIGDATEFLTSFDHHFDRVLADVPCSGSGVVFSKPDILLHEPDLVALNKIQSEILDNVSRYVKSGGRLVYSTCSLLKSENDDRVKAFLLAHPDYKLLRIFPKVGYEKTLFGVQLLPTCSDTEGFYYAVLTRA